MGHDIRSIYVAFRHKNSSLTIKTLELASCVYKIVDICEAEERTLANALSQALPADTPKATVIYIEW